jgi:hypothetical protein
MSAVAERVNRHAALAGAPKRAAGGIAMNPSMGAPARTSLCATVPPTALLNTPAAPLSRCARSATAIIAHAARAAGRDRGVEHAQIVRGAPPVVRAQTSACAALLKTKGFRDRARQDVAPGAPMDGFTAFPETLCLERRCAVSSWTRARHEARP